MAAVTGISVVIPNYNGMRLLPLVLPDLFVALKNSGFEWEIILSDDCSSDDSVDYIHKNFPAIQVLVNGKNEGFSPTINRGIFAARHSHVLLLNSDVKLTPEYFDGLTKYFEDDACFGVMSRIVGWDDDIVQDGGKYPYFHGVKIKTSGNYIPANESSAHRFYSMYLSGANAFVDREKIMLLNGFNELFAPFYVEDYELSMRAWRMGWKCYYDHRTICRHQLSVTIKTVARKNAINEIYYRNKMFLHALHLPQAKLSLWHAQVLIECLGNAAVLKFYHFKAFRQYLGKRKRVIASRKEFNALAASKGIKLLSLVEVADRVMKNIQEEAIIILK